MEESGSGRMVKFSFMGVTRALGGRDTELSQGTRESKWTSMF